MSDLPDLPALPRRPLGRTGFQASILGAGDVADRRLGTEACLAVLERAWALGINVFDTAPSYENGMSQQLVGHLVRPRRRDDFFVIDKVDKIHSDVLPQLDRNIYTLRLDRMDLAVFHGVREHADLDYLLRADGGFDWMAIGRREKLMRWIGISAHDPEIVERAILSGRCDVVMFPLGPFVDPRYRPLVGLARERGVGTVCFKTFGAGKLLGSTSGYGKPLGEDAPEPARAASTGLSADLCVRYTMTLDPDVTLLGMSTLAELEQAVAAALAFRPLTPPEMAEVEQLAADAVRGKGRVWWNPGQPIY